MQRRIGQIIFICMLVWFTISNSLPVFSGKIGKSSSKVQNPLDYSYGYGFGDHFQFADNTTETLDLQTDYLREEVVHTIGVWIEAVDEDVDYYSIRITARITNLSAGLDTYNTTCYMEGYSPIVAGPRVYFTHTNWNLHYSDWIAAANQYQQDTQLTGSVSQDLENRYFNWNLTHYIDNSTSLLDIDLDGTFDAYDIVHSYTAQFNEDGVLLLRSFYDERTFDCGARYTRLRTITLESEPTTPHWLIDPYLTTLLIIIITVVILIIAAFLLIRRYPRKGERDVTT